MKRLTTIYTIIGMLAITASAGMTTIDFDSLSGPMSSCTESGVTFTTVGSGNFSFSLTSNGSKGINSSPLSMRADIAGGTTFVSVDMGDGGTDSEILFLDIFDASNNLLDHTEFNYTWEMEDMKTLSLSSTTPNIAYAIFGSTGAYPNSIYADNFTFEPVTVPTPSAILLGSVGVGIVGWLRKRKAQ